ncbi:hypothetical protein G4B84_007140, partial [Aspergillus flavus NRRL3357]
MSEDNHDAPTVTNDSLCLTPDPEVQSLQHDNLSAKTAKVPSRKRGRPRKALGTRMDKNKKDRRRTQVRLAQRAYRSRKEANVEFLNKRAAQLEAAAQKMGEAALKEIGGDWFDVQELANYLQERDTRLLVRPPKNMTDSSSQSAVNARALIVAL